MVLLVTIFMSLVGVSIVNVALPSIQTGLGASQSEIQWVLSGYALTFGVVLVASGRAGDIFGRAPLFLAGVGIFTLSSVAAGLAPDPLMLNVARFVQGLGSGLLNPQAVGMIQQYFRGTERGRAFGMFGSMVGISVAIGPVLGGALIELGGVQQGWRWTFFVNVPVGLLAIVLALLWFPRPLLNRRASGTVGSPDQPVPPDQTDQPDQPRQLDPVGAVLLGLAVLAVLLPFVEARASVSAWLWALLPVGLVLGFIWVRWEGRYKSRGRSPMVDMAIFRTPSFSNGTLLIGLYFLGITSVWVLVAQYMQEGLGHTALESGAVGLPNAALSAVTANMAGRRVFRYGRKLVAAGTVSVLAGLGLSVLVIELHAQGTVSEWWLLATLALVGAGQGAVVSPNQTLTLAEVPLQYAGSAGGIMQTAQRVGTSVGIAIVTAVAFTVLAGSDWAQAITAGFGLIAVVIIAALLVAVRDVRSRNPISP